MMLLLATQAAAESANEAFLLWGFVLLGVTIVLLAAELFVPSGGLVGLLAGLAAIASLVAFFRYNTILGAAMTATYVILGPIAIVYGFKYWTTSPMAKLFILGDPAEMGDDEDPTTAQQRSERERRERFDQLRQLIGAQGVTETALRPVGTVRIADRRLDALSEFGVIEADQAVIVTDVYDNQIKVRPA